jgi:hypothetical protein
MPNAAKANSMALVILSEAKNLAAESPQAQAAASAVVPSVPGRVTADPAENRRERTT